MKKLQLLYLLMLLPMVAMADAIEIDGIYYNLITKGQVAEVTSNPNNYTGVVVIPEEVTYEGANYNVATIDQGAFRDCTGLTSVIISNSVTSIGASAFSGCTGLTSVTIPNSVTSIGVYAFCDCSSLTSITIPNSVTSIGERTFIGCAGLTSVTIPNSMTVIGEGVFCFCSGLTSVTIPNSVTSIGASAFYKCTGLTSVTIPNSVATIGEHAFYGCTSLTSVTIPNSVTSIGKWAFSDSKSLITVTIPNSVTSIGLGTFEGCSGLTTVTIPNSLTSIGSHTFYGCIGLTSVTIGSEVKNIDDQAFAKCSELTDVYCYAEEVPSTKSDAFQNSYVEYATLHVPAASISLYQATEPWSGFKSIVAIEGGKIQQCATPSISYNNGKLTFSCDTDGAICQSTITDPDINSYSSNEVQLGVTYTISVYATKTGYENSETATATLCWIDVEPKKEGITDGITNVPARAVMIQSNGGILTIEGADDGTPVSVYDINGTQEGAATISNGSTTINTTLQTGSIAIVMIGQKSVKVVMK